MTAPGTRSRVPLHEHALQLHRAGPDAPLPRTVRLPDEERYRRAEQRRRWQPELAGARTAALLEQRLARPLTPAALRLLAVGLAQLPVPRRPDPAVGALARHHPPELLRTVGRHLVRHGTERDAVAAGLLLLAETATEREVPLIQTVGLLGAPFGGLPAHALERLRTPAAVPALIWLAERTTGIDRTHGVHALNRLAAPRARYPWWHGPHPLAAPDRPADPRAVHWLRRRAADEGDFTGYFAGETLVAAAVGRAIADPHADPETVDQTGRLLRAAAESHGTGATLAHLDDADHLLTHYARHVVRLGPTTDRYRSVLTLAAHLAGAAAGVGAGEEGRAVVRERLIALLRSPGWPAQLAVLRGDPRGNIAGWATLAARRVGLLPDGPAPRSPRLSRRPTA
ncbi:hypothetical protein [Kitasatospora phosalacinea]|uniref:Uncharacterized protein n=1 Tax=Kitasatospora phosalacinea TaxID=2065 RepID=A0A9W6PC01_9ACTN|nr:hypothetical protein [Kitasatospora phosalacinea]GLW52172.1 hypothetical protein Kpho01_01830 [Kitasatospora phosalacinea]